MMFNNQYRNNSWMHIMGGLALVIVFFANYLEYNDFKQGFTNTILNFDKSLSMYVDKQVSTGMTDWIIPGIIIIAHIFIYIYLILLLQNYVFVNNGFFSNLIIATIVIMLLHIIQFTFIDNNPFSMNALKDMLPYSGIWHLLTNFGQLTNSIPHTSNITNTTGNYSNTTINVDLT
jgi:hypothetical protein